MEGNSTNDLTEEQLRDAGASATFITYYITAKDMGKETPATAHAERCIRRGEVYSGGGFFDALWDATHRYPNSDNPYGADEENRRILRAAGVYPHPRHVKRTS